MVLVSAEIVDLRLQLRYNEAQVLWFHLLLFISKVVYFHKDNILRLDELSEIKSKTEEEEEE